MSSDERGLFDQSTKIPSPKMPWKKAWRSDPGPWTVVSTFDDYIDVFEAMNDAIESFVRHGVPALPGACAHVMDADGVMIVGYSFIQPAPVGWFGTAQGFHALAFQAAMPPGEYALAEMEAMARYV